MTVTASFRSRCTAFYSDSPQHCVLMLPYTLAGCKALPFAHALRVAGVLLNKVTPAWLITLFL